MKDVLPVGGIASQFLKSVPIDSTRLTAREEAYGQEKSAQLFEAAEGDEA